MTWKDKLELGLKDDAAFRKDNLPANEVSGPEETSGPGRSPVVTEVRDDRTAAREQAGVEQTPGDSSGRGPQKNQDESEIDKP